MFNCSDTLLKTCVLTLVLLTTVGQASAFSYGVETGTTLYGYETAGEVVAETYTPVRFDISHKLGGHELSVIANGRIRRDFGTDSDVQGKVYYGYFQFQTSKKTIRARFGRQYINEGAAAGTIDGLSVSFGQSKKWDVNLSGGGEVSYRFGKFDYDTAKTNFLYSVHGAVTLPLLPFEVRVGTGFSGDKTEGSIDKQTLSFEAREKPLKNLTFNQEIHWDNIKKEVSYQFYGIRYRPVDRLRLYGSFRYSQPRISNASILSVFAHDTNQVIKGGGELVVNDWMSVSSEYSTTVNRPRPGCRTKVGASNWFDYVNVYYGGMFGKAPERFYGGFTNAEFPRPLSFLEKLSAGTVFEYIKYKYDESQGLTDTDALMFDVHGNYAVFKFLNATAGFQTLKNRERSHDVRGYLEIGVTLG
ncbi:MAG: hypothetical protein JSW52_06085 [Candidatus Coatesbacteria bacterium]|nr:MAG: hypothetical protein JSW52_06085 [Candidatus Coatesbacteria bacterium]